MGAPGTEALGAEIPEVVAPERAAPRVARKAAEQQNLVRRNPAIMRNLQRENPNREAAERELEAEASRCPLSTRRLFWVLLKQTYIM